ncbi:MAG: HAD-IC family P-type ATPase [Mariprofundaceae bacterium]|nr:HAD-IC family P-type ATPase [Mariprofundaceae bacterium]
MDKITDSISEPVPPYSQSVKEVLNTYASSTNGLSQPEAAIRLEEYGPNTLPEAAGSTLFQLVLRQFLSPLIYILLLAAVVSLLLGEFADAGFIFAVLVINAVIGVIQEFHAQKSAEALKSMVSDRAVVMRDGDTFDIDTDELVPGDIVMLESGSKVPADLRLIHCFGLEVDESLLTGESVAVNKTSDSRLDPETPMADRINMLFYGTIVARGRGHGVVTATGLQTEIGHLAQALESGDEAKPPLVQRMEKFTVGIAIALGIAVLILAAIEFRNGVGWQEIFMVSVALAVSAIPEGLPVALTVALAIGMNRMSRRNVIIRRLVAVESLGSCTVIASDKTGTLTLNQLTVRKVVIPGGGEWEITGEGDIPEGGAISSVGSLSIEEELLLGRICQTAVLCNEAVLSRRNDAWVTHGDAVDVALLIMAHKMGVIQAPTQNRYPLITRIPYESERGFAATLHSDGNRGELFVKGALEQLLPMCSEMALPEGLRPLNIELAMSGMESLAEQGYRTLALAHGVLQGTLPEELGHDQLKGLTLLGIVAMNDPLRVESQAAVFACRQAGIRTCMITGDHPSTAFAIAREIGLAEHIDEVVTGHDLKLLEGEDTRALDDLVASSSVFARVEPGQKASIVHALQRAGHFVAVTGDGANDAPSLKAAHVGVAMGKRGTDVAKECSDLVIVDDNFASIVAGVEEGRIVYRNIRKVIFLLISTGAAELVLFFLSMLAGLPLPLTAVQLLWLNLVTNGIQDVALAFEPGEGNEMKQPPRSPDEPIFNRIMIERVLISAAVMGLLAFLAFQYLTSLGMELETARNSTLLLMVLFENVHVFNCRSETRSVFSHSPLRNRVLFFGTLIAQLVHIGAMYWPAMAGILHIHPVSLDHWFELLAIALSMLAVMELHKWLHRRWGLHSRQSG